MNETLINLLQQNRAEKIEGKNKRKMLPSSTVVIEKIPQEKQQPGPSRQYKNLAESSHDESRRR